jgi:hypothetical protein
LFHKAEALNVTLCYLCVDKEIDAERCRISVRKKSPITLCALDSTGRISCSTGVVQSIQPDPYGHAGMRWLIEMDLLTVASPNGGRRKTRQRMP